MRRIFAILSLNCVLLLGACALEAIELMADAAEVISLLPTDSTNSNQASSPERPLVSIGQDQIVTEGELVNLTSSADPSIDSEDLVYEWKKTIGPKITMDTSERGTASFVAPPAKKIRTLRIRLKARAENGNVYEDSAVVVVKPASLSDSLQ